MSLLRAPLLFLSLLLMMPLAEAQSRPIEPVDEIFSAYDDNSPGCALGVIREGEFIYRRGYGLANMEYDIPISSRTVFRIGSTSKQFTAAAIALLAGQGKLGLDDPLSKYYPGFPEWADKVTIRQLVLHTSGIRDYLQLAYLAGKVNDADFYTDEWAIGLLAKQRETNFPPGDQHLYSNSGYLLMAHLVEKASGQSLKDYAEANIFKPLAMENTHFHDDHTHIVPLRADGYEPTEEGYRISMTTLDMVGDGGVYTTIDDLLLWDRNFYDNRLGNGGPELITQLTTPGTLNDGTALEYAFGLSVSDDRGLKRVDHGGAFVGFRADMIRFPEQKFTTIVLCNRSDGAPSRKGGKVVDYFLSDTLEAQPGAGSEDPEAPYTVPKAELSLYAGDFWEASEGFAAETRVDEGKLWAVHSPDRRNELQPIGPHQFRMLDVGADVIVTFEMSDSGIEQVTRTVNGNPRGVFTPFQRRQATAEALGMYAGMYYSEELQVSYRLFLRDDRLHFQVADAPEQELTALFGETFENPDWGSFEFSRGSSGKVTGFVLQSGRVRNLEFSRK